MNTQKTSIRSAYYYFDFDEIKNGCILLLNKKHGKIRTEKLRTAIKGSTKSISVLRLPPPLLAIVEFSRFAPLAALTLLDDCDAARNQMIEKFADEHPKIAAEIQKKTQNVNRYRERIRLTLQAEELLRDEKLSPEEAHAFLEAKKAEWKKRLSDYIQARPSTMDWREASADFTEKLSEEVREHFEFARLNRGIKSRKVSDVKAANSNRNKVSENKLQSLEFKFNRR